MTSEQMIYYVNCLGCGEILEVVYPYIGQVPSRVIARGTGHTAPSGFDVATYTVCTKCKIDLRVYWTR